MAYTPNPTWISSTAITTAKLDNLETQYGEANTYFLAHNHDDLYPTIDEMAATYWYAGNSAPGSGSDADLLYKASGNLHAASFYGLGVPTGLIILWYGSVASIPTGWALCNGSGGTVDLRDKFVVGAGNTYNPGTTGGSTTFTVSGTVTVDAHVLTTAEMGAHRHPFTDKYCSSPATSGHTGTHGFSGTLTAWNGNTWNTGGGSGHGHSAGEGTSFSGNAVACMPFYYSLAYIQKT